MKNPSTPLLRRCASLLGCAAIAIALPISAAAGRIALGIDRIDGPDLRAEALRLMVDEAAATATIELARLEVPALSWSQGPLRWHCRLRNEDGVSVCSGRMQTGEVDGEFSIRADARHVRLSFEDAHTQVQLAIPRGAGPVAITTRALPLAPLGAMAAGSLPEGLSIRAGTVDGDLEWTSESGLEGRLAWSGLTVEDRVRGWRIDEADGAGRIAVNPADPLRVHAQARLGRGVYSGAGQRIALSGGPVDLRLDLRRGDGTLWQVDRFEWRDPGRIEVSGSATLDAAAAEPLRHLALNVERSQWPEVVERYGRAAWSAAGLDGVHVSGIARGRLTVEDGVPVHADLDLERLSLREATGVRLDGVQGALAWRARGNAPATQIGWRAASFDGFALGRGRIGVQQRQGRWMLARAAALPLLGGDLRIEHLVFDPNDAGRPWLDARFAASGLAYDSADGRYGAAGLAVGGSLTLEGAYAQPRARLDARVDGGELLAGTVYVKFPTEPVRIGLDAELGSERIRLHALEWIDPGVADLRASGVLRRVPALALASLELDLRRVELGPALARYGRTALAAKGYDGLEAEGALSGHLIFDESGIERFDFAARQVGLRDPGGRFAVAGLSGGVDWRHRADRPATTLSWESMEILQLPFGAAHARFESRNGRITLAEPIGIDVLGGQLRLERLDLQPRSPRGERYSASFAIAAIEMAQLSQLLGWPSFPGNLSGGIPEVVLSGDTIELRGGLDLYVFDGYLGVSGLRLERPFGIAPSLAADVHFHNFDLEQVTSAFSLGGMSGRLDGTIGGLRLVDWGLVGFDAWLRTQAGGRMSYKAVNDVASLGGGGGLSANLQTMALQLFDTFGYRRFGLRCRLRAEVCTMGGIEPVPPEAGPASDGYTIVEGAGLPRITIVGHQRRVDWPVLVERIVEATTGQGPIIQ
ncbi:MAG TPA: hypothetical protein VMR06_14805 [Dokdonella sp.]|uniref:hypothetical protein n=1 Tax=Dokdonella sp. TaxID=2291710 RepID=UPI002B8B02E2|nr:hypothetical protein [Dokdonella sp.]HUD43259.1 hypothetical protein [Dokdonella sp.]